MFNRSFYAQNALHLLIFNRTKRRKLLQPEKSNSYEGRIFARCIAQVLANPSMIMAHHSSGRGR